MLPKGFGDAEMQPRREEAGGVEAGAGEGGQSKPEGRAVIVP